MLCKVIPTARAGTRGGLGEHVAATRLVHPVPVPSQPTSEQVGAADLWADWLLVRRQGGHDVEPSALAELRHYRDAVLSGAAIRPRDVLLDVGCGDGLIGFGALEAASGQNVRVVFSDISGELLQRCRERAVASALIDRCNFLECGAEDLALVPDQSVDIVTTRSVLIYVANKQKAFAEFFRVLRPEGRLSVMEPINSRMYPEPSELFWGWDVSSVPELRARVVAEFDRASPSGMHAMMSFDEDDLVRFAEDAGFVTVDLLLHTAVGPAQHRDWERLLHSSPNPLAPTLAEAVANSLDRTERDRFLEALRMSVEAGVGRRHLALAYLRATKSVASAR